MMAVAGAACPDFGTPDYRPGLASAWSEWAVLWSVFLIAEVGRALASGSRWSGLVARIPVIARFALIVGAAFLFGWLTMKPVWHSGTTLLPLIYALGPTLVVAGALLPRRMAGGSK